MHLAMMVEDHEGEVVGPAASVGEALAMIATGSCIHGAILDGNLGDGDVTPVALQLLAASIPLVIYSGVGVPGDLDTQHPGLPVVLKPAGAARAVSLLDQQINAGPLLAMPVPAAEVL